MFIPQLKSKNDYFFTISLFGVCSSLPFNNIILNSICIILLTISWIAEGSFSDKWEKIKKNNVLLTFLVFYFIHIIFMFSTENIKAGLFELEKKLSLFILPLILYSSSNIDENKRKLSALTFTIATSFMLLYSIFQIFLYLHNGGPLLLQPDGTYDYREYFVQIAERHPTYTSMYIFFCIINILSIKKDTLVLKAICTITIIFSALVIILLSSRLIIFGSLIFILFYVIKKRAKFPMKATLAAVFSIFLISAILILSITSVKSRLVTEFFDAYTFGPAIGIHYNSINTRISEYICGTEIIANNPIFGVGTGDVQDELNNCYREKGYSSVLYERSYNPHNQYIFTYAGLGLPGIVTLLILLYLLFTSFDIVFKPEYSYVIFIITLLFFTETFLSLQKGVVFFSLFAPLLQRQNQPL